MAVWQSSASSEKFWTWKEMHVTRWHRFSRLCNFCSIRTEEHWLL